MPAGRKPQSNAMLYTLITFVGFFIVATTVAVIFYLKFEEERTIAETATAQYEEVVSPLEHRKGMGKIVGTVPRNKSVLGTMVDYLDDMVYLIIGGMPEDTSAEVKIITAKDKIETVDEKFRKVLAILPQEYLDPEDIDPNSTGLIRIIEKLKIKLDGITSELIASQVELEEVHNEFSDAMDISREKETLLSEEKDQYHQQVKDIQERYNELKDLVEQTSEERVQSFMTKIGELQAEKDRLKNQLLETQAKLALADDRMNYALEQMRAIGGKPSMDTPAFKRDGIIILIDNEHQMVHLNIGSDDRVYPGLTFAVYDRTVPIPKEGKGKAEVEVLEVKKNVSVARIIPSKTISPIIVDDVVANLIWDSEKTNTFVVAGEFDLDGDGTIDSDATDRIKTLIEKWGGVVADIVTIKTDFVVLGNPPTILAEPTIEVIELYPMATEKYRTSVRKRFMYDEAQSRAQTLSVPIFNYERFLFLIGYKSQAPRAGAF